MLSLAKAKILWNWSVKVHRYMICGVVATSISGCDVCTVCRVVCDCLLQYTACVFVLNVSYRSSQNI